jgi:chromosomal replication initiation ATPase DnaA
VIASSGSALTPYLVPRRFESASFATFTPKTESQRVAHDAVREWTTRAAKKQGPMLALIGSQGAGKSHLLYAAVLHVLREMPAGTVYSRPWYRLADELRYGGPSVFAPHLPDEASEVCARLWRHSIVFLDEVRSTASTALDENELAKFACHAYDSRVAVLITTNVNPLKDVMGAAAASRFTQIVIDGPDRRQA